MLSQINHCHKCSSNNLVKNGTNVSGYQRYKCKDCGVCMVFTPKSQASRVDKETVLRTFEERNSYRSTGSVFNISHTTVFNWLKKAHGLNPFKTTGAEAGPGDVLEVDEILSYLLLKVNKTRVWMALSKQTRQIVSFFIGDGSMGSCKRLLRKLPCFT